MISSRRHSFVKLSAVVLLLSAAGCSDQIYVTPEDPNAAVIQLAPVPPPAPSDEIKPEIMDPRMEVWRPGHWDYENQRYFWVPGEVLTRPSPTAVWSADRWEHRKYGWAFIHGYWQ